MDDYTSKKTNNTQTNLVRASGAIGAGLPAAMITVALSGKYVIPARYAIPAVTATALTGAAAANGLFYIGKRMDRETIKDAATIAGAGAIGGATLGVGVGLLDALTTPSYQRTEVPVAAAARVGAVTSLVCFGLFAGGKRCYDKMNSVDNTNSNSETPSAPGQ